MLVPVPVAIPAFARLIIMGTALIAGALGTALIRPGMHEEEENASRASADPPHEHNGPLEE